MIRAEAVLYDEKTSADCAVTITGNSEAIAVEYATITVSLMRAKGGQAILDRATDIMKKEINEHEEKRSK